MAGYCFRYPRFVLYEGEGDNISKITGPNLATIAQKKEQEISRSFANVIEIDSFQLSVFRFF